MNPNLDIASETRTDSWIPKDLTALTREISLPDPLSLIRPDSVVWIHNGSGFIGWGEAARMDCGTGSRRFDSSADAVDELFDQVDTNNPFEHVEGTGPVAFGSFTFDADTPGSSVVLPRHIVRWIGNEAWQTTVSQHPADLHPPGPHEPQQVAAAPAVSLTQPDNEPWLESVRRALELIEAGQLEKVVLARRLNVTSDLGFDIPSIVRRLVSSYPSCFTFVFEGLLGASPELLVRLRGTSVESVPLAGSAPRGSDMTADKSLASKLESSEKNLLEHRLAVESVVEPLQTLCHLVKASSHPEVLQISGVQHLATKVTGQLHTPVSSLSLAGALHPTAAVCGTPREIALQVIRDLEEGDRGRYAGVTGWVDDHGDGDWALALRCAQVSNGTADLFAGSGIVRGSIPEQELAETELKLKALLTALS